MHKTTSKISSLIFMLLMICQLGFAQDEDNHEHSEQSQAHLAFQCAVCSNHLGYIEPNDEIKGGFAFSTHKHAVVEVEGLYQCAACKTPIFKAKSVLDVPSDNNLIYFNRPLTNNSVVIGPYNVANLGELKEHCPVCANKFANSRHEVVNGNFGSRISFKDLRKIFKN